MEEKAKFVITKMNEAGKPLRPGEIAELAGLSKEEVSGIMKNLKKAGKVYSPKRCFYAPSEE